MSPRQTAIALAAYALFSALAHLADLRLPPLGLPFHFGDKVGWVLLGLLLLLASRLGLGKGASTWGLSPLTQRQIQRFTSIRRGLLSLWILVALTLVAALDTWVVGKRPLVLRYEGQWYFPFATASLPASRFGLEGEGEADYRQLQKRWLKEKAEHWMILPLVPYDSKLDTPEVVVPLREDPVQQGRWLHPQTGKPFNGQAYSVFASKPDKKRQEWGFRDGLRHGEMRGFDLSGEWVEQAQYEQGREVSRREFKAGATKTLAGQASEGLLTLIYPPASPSLELRHYLGTTASGGDVLAILFGGLQQAIVASLLFVGFVFVVGTTVGGLLGYFGGVADLLGMRLLETWSVLPFLFIVMIVSSVISPSLLVLVGIIALFGWMGTTAYIRTAVLREKARDYVASARLLGAGPWRILWQHILPNSIAVLVTLAPFEVAGIITSLAALDYLGFGLPPEEPSWGRLLHEGTEDFNYPWIVSSAFVAMTTVLVLVTFVGEAVREAFDPKKWTVYR